DDAGMEPVPPRRCAASGRRLEERARRVPPGADRRAAHAARGQHVVSPQPLSAALLESLVRRVHPSHPRPGARAREAPFGGARSMTAPERAPLIPYVAPQRQIPELTLRALLLGALLSLAFGMVNSYLALKIGLTVSASIPSAVLS